MAESTPNFDSPTLPCISIPVIYYFPGSHYHIQHLSTQAVKFRIDMNVLLLGSTMSLWTLVAGLSFFTNPTGLVRFPAPLHQRGHLLYNVNMYNPTHFKLEDRESTQIRVLRDMMPLQLLYKNHIRSTFLPKISKSALSKTPNPKSTFFFFFLFFVVFPFPSFAGSHHPCEASYQTALSVTMQLTNHSKKVVTKFNT